jgi:hypothetical protein
MAQRYYFHLRYRDRLFRDEEGDALPDEAAVRAHAQATMQDLIQTRSDTIRDWFDCTFEVTNERGAVVLVLPFAASKAERGA